MSHVTNSQGIPNIASLTTDFWHNDNCTFSPICARIVQKANEKGLLKVDLQEKVSFFEIK